MGACQSLSFLLLLFVVVVVVVVVVDVVVVVVVVVLVVLVLVEFIGSKQVNRLVVYFKTAYKAKKEPVKTENDDTASGFQRRDNDDVPLCSQSSINICHFNARPIRNKMEEISYFTKQNIIHIFTILGNASIVGQALDGTLRFRRWKRSRALSREMSPISGHLPCNER